MKHPHLHEPRVRVRQAEQPCPHQPGCSPTASKQGWQTKCPESSKVQLRVQWSPDKSTVTSQVQSWARRSNRHLSDGIDKVGALAQAYPTTRWNQNQALKPKRSPWAKGKWPKWNLSWLSFKPQLFTQKSDPKFHSCTMSELTLSTNRQETAEPVDAFKAQTLILWTEKNK